MKKEETKAYIDKYKIQVDPDSTKSQLEEALSTFLKEGLKKAEIEIKDDFTIEEMIEAFESIIEEPKEDDDKETPIETRIDTVEKVAVANHVFGKQATLADCLEQMNKTNLKMKTI